MAEETTINMVTGFLKNVDKYLSMIVEHQEVLLERPDGEIQEVWDEVKQKLVTLIGDLEKLEEDEFVGKLKDSEIGISPKQLRWEIEGFNKVREEFDKVTQTPPRNIGVVGRILRKILRWLNIILGSLSAMFPQLGAVKEIKEAIEQKLK